MIISQQYSCFSHYLSASKNRLRDLDESAVPGS
jgi:hypothetical protein